MKEYFRNCPRCNRKLNYNYAQSFYLAKKRNSLCKSCSSKEISQRPNIKEKLLKHSLSCKGKNNPFYGKTHSEETKNRIKKVLTEKEYWKSFQNKGGNFYNQWVKNFGESEANKKMRLFKKRQSLSHLGNKNSMFGKPSPQGSGNGWSGWYRGWYFRSLIELSYMIKVIERFSLKWKSAECKELAIPYTNWDGKQKTYFADFLINDKYLVECKPKKLHGSVSVQSKTNGAIRFCSQNKMKYKLRCITILNKKTIQNLVRKNQIIFLPRYQEKYKKLYETPCD